MRILRLRSGMFHDGLQMNISLQTSGQQATPSDTAVRVSQTPRMEPRFVRLPRSGQLCPFTGLSRTQIYQLCKTGKVKSHSLKQRGTCRGVRLIDFQSLVAAVQDYNDAGEQAVPVEIKDAASTHPRSHREGSTP